MPMHNVKLDIIPLIYRMVRFTVATVDLLAERVLADKSDHTFFIQISWFNYVSSRPFYL